MMRRDSQRRFDALRRASWDAVYMMSADWSQMHALDGRGFIADTNAPSESWLEKYIAAEDQPYVLAAIRRAVEAKDVFQLEHRVRRSDGSVGWTMSRAVPFLDDDGEILEWVGAAIDLTTRRQAEQESGVAESAVAGEDRRFGAGSDVELGEDR